MKPIAAVAFGPGAFGLALVGGAVLASAQTTVTRQITDEPVETTITQGPAGTIVTRRPLDPTPDPGAPAFVPGPLRYPSAAVSVGESPYQAVSQDTAPTVTTSATTRRVVRHRVSTNRVSTNRPAPPRATERPTTTGLATRMATRTVAHAVTTSPAPPAAAQPLVLTAAQRQIIYRTILRRDVYPPPVVAAPPVVAETEVAPPPDAYPLRTIYPAGDYAYDYAAGGYRAYGYGWSDRYRYPYRWDGVPLVVGARLPDSIPLAPVPEPVAATVPVIAPLSYAYVDDRVYLVDPATGIIMAEVTP